MADYAGSASRASNALRDIADLLDTFAGKKGEKLAAAQENVAQAHKHLAEAEIALRSLNQELADCENRIRALEDELKKVKNKQAEKENMNLTRIAGGAFVYTPKSVEDSVQTGLWYCQPCLDDEKRSVLQFAQREFTTDRYQCPRCGAAIQVPHDERPNIAAGGRRRSADLDDF